MPLGPVGFGLLGGLAGAGFGAGLGAGAETGWIRIGLAGAGVGLTTGAVWATTGAREGGGGAGAGACARRRCGRAARFLTVRARGTSEEAITGFSAAADASALSGSGGPDERTPSDAVRPAARPMPATVAIVHSMMRSRRITSSGTPWAPSSQAPGTGRCAAAPCRCGS